MGKYRLDFYEDENGDRVILLLAGYDKLAQPSKSHQNEQIKLARKRLASWKRGQAKVRARRRSP